MRVTWYSDPDLWGTIIDDSDPEMLIIAWDSGAMSCCSRDQVVIHR